MFRSTNINIQYRVDLADHGTKQMLAADRKMRSEVARTSREMTRASRGTATAAAQAGRAATRGAQAHAKAGSIAAKASQQTARASQRAALAHTREGTAARTASRGLAAVAKSNQAAATGASRAAVQATRVARSYDQVARAARNAERAQRSSNSAMSKVGSGKGTGLFASVAAGGAGGRLAGRVGGPAAAGIGLLAAVKAGVSFEKQMDRVQAVAGASSREMGRMGGQAKQLGADTQFSAQEAAQGMYQLSTAGFTAQETMRIIPGTLDLAAASGVDLASAAELQAAALRGFGLEASQAGHVADVMAKAVNSSAVEMADLGEMLPYVASTAKQTGTSFEQVAAAAGILGNAGIKGSMAGTALRTSMLRLTDPSAKMSARFKEMGIDGKELAAIPLPNAIGKIAEGLKKLPTRGEKVGAISAIFGKEAAPAMLNLMSKGRGEIDRLTEAMEHSDGAAAKSAKTMRENAAGAWDEFTGSVETAAISLTAKGMPALATGFRAGAKFVNQFTSALSGKGGKGVGGEMGKTMRYLAGGIGDVVKALRPAMPLFKLIGGAMLKVLGLQFRAMGIALRFVAHQIGLVTPLLGALAKAAGPVARLVGRGLVSAFRAVVSFGRGAGRAMAGVASAIASALGPVGRVMGAVFRRAFIVVKGIVTTGAKVVGGIFYAWVSVLSVPLRLAILAITKAWGPIKSILGVPVKAGFAVVKAVFNTGRAAISGAVKGIVSGVRAWWGGIKAVWGPPIRAGIGVVKSILGAAVGPIKSAAGAIWSGIKSAFNGVKGFFSTLFNGAASALRTSFDAVKDVINTMISAFNKLPGPDIGLIGGGGSASSMGPKLRQLADQGGPSSGGTRRGGRITSTGVTRYQGGGMVPILAAGGEMYIAPGGASTMVPGDPRSDSTLLMARPGAMVLTGDGQMRYQGGEPLGSVLRTQAPHFATGGRVVGASLYGMGERGTGTRGYKGDYLPGKQAYAELGMGKALGGLPYRHPLDISYRGRSVTARKLDIGKGGGEVSGHTRAIDLWRDTANALRFRGLGLVQVKAAGSDPGRQAGSFVEAQGKRVPDLSPLSAKDARRWLPNLLKGIGDEAPFSRGFALGLEGLKSIFGTDIMPDVDAASKIGMTRLAGTKFKRGDRLAASATGGSGAFGRMVSKATAIDSQHYRYAWGGGHNSSFSPPYDCSGAVSAVLHAGGLLGSPMTSGQFMSWGQGGAGKQVTILTNPGHMYMKLGSRYWGTSKSNPRGGAGWFSGGPRPGFARRHPRGMRAGGIVGMGGRGTIAAAPPRGASNLLGAIAGAGASAGRAVGLWLERLAQMLDNVDHATTRRLRAQINTVEDQIKAIRAGGVKRSERGQLAKLKAKLADLRKQLPEAQKVTFDQLDSMRDSIRSQIKALTKGGLTRSERVKVRRLQSSLTLVESEMGRRVGLMVKAATDAATAMQTGETRLGQGMRIQGVEEASSRGIAMTREFLEAQSRSLVEQGEQLTGALDQARTMGATDVVDQVTEQLTGVWDAWVENTTRMAELAREGIVQAARDQVDAAAFQSALDDVGLQTIEAQQRLDKTFDTAGGQGARADYIRREIVPSLQAEAAALKGAFDAELATGDLAGSRDAELAWRQKMLDVLNAQLAADEATAENTEPLKDLGGTLGFEYRGDRFTDVTVGS